MIHSSQNPDLPATEGRKAPPLWSADDALVVQKLRQDAERDGIDWRSVPLGPSVVQRAVDLLFPAPKKCGQTRAYRIQKLVPLLPEGPPADQRVRQSAPEDDQSAEPLAEAVSQSAEAPRQSIPLARGIRSLRQRGTYRKAERAEAEPEGESSGRPERAWPLILIAASAFVGLWGGWVGLGEMTGFGMTTPLPGIVTWQMNAAITLPLGVEVLAAYAIRAWLSGYGTRRTRKLAKRAAIGCLVLGAAGQTAFHLMKVAEVPKDGAPWQITALVSVIPIVSIGIASGLHHMLATDRKAHKARQKVTA